MRNLLTLIGVLLIGFGIFGLAYKYYPYKTEQNVAVVGPLKVGAEQREFVYFPPLLSGLSLAAGVVLVVLSRRNGK